jgi:hypothetical protein
MDSIIKMIAEKAGISEAQAQTALTTLMGFLKDKMPGGLGAQVEGFLESGGAAAGGDMLGGLKDKIGGILGS